jgi:hypothetical protein
MASAEAGMNSFYFFGLKKYEALHVNLFYLLSMIDHGLSYV